MNSTNVINDEERREFLYTSGMMGNRAYSDDEPEYTDAHLIERNPNYQPNDTQKRPDLGKFKF